MNALAMRRTTSPATYWPMLVVQSASGQDHFFRGTTNRGRLVRQLIGIDANAVPTDQPRSKREEVPLGTGRMQHLLGIDAETLEYHGQFI